jgi:hypothetical protein
LPQVQSTFALYKTADKAEIEKELTKVIAGIEAGGMDPSQSPKAKELQAKLQSEAVDVVKLEGEVYDHHLATPPGARLALIGSLGLRVDPRSATPCPLRARRRSAALRRCCLRM